MDSENLNIKSRARRLTQDQAFNQQGKLPPQSRELEEAVLGAVMLDKSALADIEEKLRPEFFYFKEHRIIYEAISLLSARQDPIDILTVTSELRKNGKLDIVGGAYYISQLTSRVASAANIEYHAHIIAQKYIQRELIRICTDLTNKAFDETSDVLNILQEAEQELLSVSEKNFRTGYSSMQSLIKESKEEIIKASESKSGISGIPTGFTELDRVTSGFQKGNFIVVAARPGMGKTAFSLSMAKNMAVDRGLPVAFFSLEMSGVELVTRLSANQTMLPLGKLKKGNLEPHEWTQYNTKAGGLAEAPIYIDDTPQLSIHELRSKCRRLKLNHDIQMVFVDYLQLMQGPPEIKNNRQEEISMISRQLKGLAKELKIPVLAMSQLSRAVETRGGDKKPQLSDLRESGAIEQDADMVMFIYRPEYYKIDKDEAGTNTLGLAEIAIAKHRNGPTADIRMKFVPHFAQFMDAAPEFGNGVDDASDGFPAMPSNNDFDSKPSISIPSKMNDMMDDNTFTMDESVPF